MLDNLRLRLLDDTRDVSSFVGSFFLSLQRQRSTLLRQQQSQESKKHTLSLRIKKRGSSSEACATKYRQLQYLGREKKQQVTLT